MSQIISNISNFLWSTPLVVVITVTSLYLMVRSKFFAYKNIKSSLKLMLVKNHDEYKISTFQALASGLSATIGMGNIAGVAVAIVKGGPGALFWMWVAGLIGINLKFFETASAIVARKEENGVFYGGAMYTIKKYNKSTIGKILSVGFALCGLIGTLSIFQVNQLAALVEKNYGIPNLWVGSTISVFVMLVIVGGYKRIGKITSILVPVMCVSYVASCAYIIFNNAENIIPVFKLILKSAFSFDSVIYGTIGYSIKESINHGFKRATFSNESGLGTTPLAHTDSSVEDPINEGLVAMIGVVIDTHIICSLTALAVLTSGIHTDMTGIELVSKIFETNFGKSGQNILMLSVLLFSFTTMVGMANYNHKCWVYFFGNSKKSKKCHNGYYMASIFLGAIVAPALIIDILDISYALMLIPNLYAIKLTYPEIKKLIESKNVTKKN
jgi:alanine or glycine:cation symporter, AGCS family